MKIELTKADMELESTQRRRKYSPAPIHRVHSELWVRVLTAVPMGPDNWDLIKHKVEAEDLAGYARKPCAFYSDIWEDDDPEREQFNFEQWWVFPSIEGWVEA